MLRLHIVERLHRILVLVERAAADPHLLRGSAHGVRLAGLHHPLGLRHLHEDLRQGVRGHNVILDLSRHLVRLLWPFVFTRKASYHISVGNATKFAEILLTKTGKVPPVFSPSPEQNAG